MKRCTKTVRDRNSHMIGRFIGWESTNKNVGWILMDDGTVRLGKRENILMTVQRRRGKYEVRTKSYDTSGSF